MKSWRAVDFSPGGDAVRKSPELLAQSYLASGRFAYAQKVPEVVALVRELHGQRQSLRQVSKTLASQGHLTGGGIHCDCGAEHASHHAWLTSPVAVDALRSSEAGGHSRRLRPAHARRVVSQREANGTTRGASTQLRVCFSGGAERAS